MAVESFIPMGGVKQSIEKEVRPRPKTEDLTTVEKPGKPTPASMLEDTQEDKPMKKRPIKTLKTADAEEVTKKDSILIITEKPQAAMKIASALGDERKLTENGVSYYQVERNNEKIIVASAVGHLYNLNYVKGQEGWPIFDLEWIPSYDRKSAAFTKKYFMLLKKLSKRAKEYVVATDFDNEGEVIGWNVLRFICNKKTAKRMKFSTLTKDELIDLLKKEPSSRQGVVVTWDPSQDGLSSVKKKNIPCLYTFTVNIIGGRLHLHNIIRSNDVMLGVPGDVAGFVFLMSILAQKLGVKPGIYSHSISNAHIYSNHYDGAKEIIKRSNNHKKIILELPEKAFEKAEKMDKKFTDKVIENLTKQYNPMEAIGGLKIAL